MRLRETLGWRQLESEFLSPEGKAVANITQVRYSSGGHYGMSRRALMDVVRSNCLWKVANTPSLG